MDPLEEEAAQVPFQVKIPDGHTEKGPLQKILEEVLVEGIWVLEDIREVEELHTVMIVEKEAFLAEAAEVQAVLEAVARAALEAVDPCTDTSTDVKENIDIEKVVKIVSIDQDIAEDLSAIIVEMMEKAA